MGSMLLEVRPGFWTIRNPRHKTASWFDQPLDLAPTRRQVCNGLGLAFAEGTCPS